jgi:hypothetical protein
MEFAHATVEHNDSQITATGFLLDRHMLACTILYTLSGGMGTNDQALDFDELMEKTKSGFDADNLFDCVKAGRLELQDLLCAMLDPKIPLEQLLKRPFYW